MKKALFVCIISFCSFAFGQQLTVDTPENIGFSTERLSRLTHTFEKYAKEGDLPGGVILLARKNKIAYHQAFGVSDIEKNTPMTKQHIFRIASQTKAIVSVGIMILQEEGKLLISDPLSKYIPEFKETTVAQKNDSGGYKVVKANREITLRDLLSHTSGIDYGYGVASDQWEKANIQGWYFADRDEPILETIKRMAALPNTAQPGERFVYGYNTDILGTIIEIASGQTLEDFLQQKILDPLNMKDTHFYLPKSKVSRLAVVYNQEEGKLKRAPKEGTMNAQGHYLNGPRKSFSGGAGLLSTSSDYATFLQMMLNEGIYDGTRILSRKSVELMTTNHLGTVKFPWTNGTGFGLGFSIITDIGNFGELSSKDAFGWGGAYHSTYWVDPKEELVVVYFTQVIPITLDDHQKIRALIYQAIID